MSNKARAMIKTKRITKQRRIQILESEVARQDSTIEVLNHHVGELSGFPFKVYKLLFPKAIDADPKDIGPAQLHFLCGELEKLIKPEKAVAR